MLKAYTAFQVVLSFVGIATGLVVLAGMRVANPLDGWTTVFLATTVATSLTGFFFPFDGFKPSYVVGLLSLIVLGLDYLARYGHGLEGHWRSIHVVSAVVALYFNVFVLVVQAFLTVPALRALAPTQTEAPFKLAQLAVLRFHVEPASLDALIR